MTFQMTINGDVSRVSNLFGEVGGIKNELRSEVGVFLVALQHT